MCYILPEQILLSLNLPLNNLSKIKSMLAFLNPAARLPFIVALALVPLLSMPINSLAAAQSSSTHLQTADFLLAKSDHRQYRSLSLANGLPVLVISDPAAQRSAATLDLAVGSSSDPLEAQGLAHYLEHMLFLGTESYPEIDGFQNFIAQSGGSYNASTGPEHTNYFFETAPDQFDPGLDRFADFFIAPLFPEQYSMRERDVIDSEYSGGLSSDGRRYWALLKALVNSEHPMSKFNVGNKQTLAGAGKQLQALLQAFYSEHYHTGKMRLVLYGPYELDQLEQLARERFSKLRPAPASSPAAVVAPPLFAAEVLPARVDYRPLRDIYSLSLNFPIPSQQQLWRSKSVYLLSHLLGHEAVGSLAYTLKHKQWINSLQSGLSFDYTDSALFSINIDLSALGQQHIDEITEFFFAWVRLLQQQDDWRAYYAELQTINQQQFDYQQLSSASSITRNLARDWHYVDDDSLLMAADYLFLDYKAEAVRELLGLLNPENMLQIVADPEANTDKVEPYYQVHYAHKAWTAAAIEIDGSDLQLPAANKFISSEISLLPPEASFASPKQISSCNHDGRACLEAWHHLDLSYDLPQANYYFNLRSPLLQRDARSRYLLDIWIELVKERLNPHLYDAELAGYDYQIYPTTRGVTVRLSGFSEHLGLVLEAVLKEFANGEFDAASFERVQHERQLDLRNSMQDAPLRLAFEQLQNQLNDKIYPRMELAEAGVGITLADLQAAHAEFLASGSMLALAHGNLSQEQAVQLNETLKAQIPRTAQAVPQLLIDDLESNRSFNTNSIDSDYAAIVYLQAHIDGEATAANLLIADAHSRLIKALLQGRFFQQLRTEEQLGYSVAAYDYRLFERSGLAFAVQSNNSASDYLRERIYQFINESGDYLQQLSDADLQPYQQGLSAKIARKAESLDKLSGRYWSELDLADVDFARRQKLAEAVTGIDSTSLQRYWATISTKPRLAIVTTPSAAATESQ